MSEPNSEALIAARAIVADRYNAAYHRKAIMSGAWDTGSLVKDALRDILTKPEMSEGEE
jgi:hypothetical protein